MVCMLAGMVMRAAADVLVPGWLLAAVAVRAAPRALDAVCLHRPALMLLCSYARWHVDCELCVCFGYVRYAQVIDAGWY
jgi:hypothetical protein